MDGTGDNDLWAIPISCVCVHDVHDLQANDKNTLEGRVPLEFNQNRRNALSMKTKKVYPETAFAACPKDRKSDEFSSRTFCDRGMSSSSCIVFISSSDENPSESGCGQAGKSFCPRMAEKLTAALTTMLNGSGRLLSRDALVFAARREAQSMSSRNTGRPTVAFVAFSISLFRMAHFFKEVTGGARKFNCSS